MQARIDNSGVVMPMDVQSDLYENSMHESSEVQSQVSWQELPDANGENYESQSEMSDTYSRYRFENLLHEVEVKCQRSMLVALETIATMRLLSSPLYILLI